MHVDVYMERNGSILLSYVLVAYASSYWIRLELSYRGMLIRASGVGLSMPTDLTLNICPENRFLSHGTWIHLSATYYPVVNNKLWCNATVVPDVYPLPDIFFSQRLQHHYLRRKPKSMFSRSTEPAFRFGGCSCCEHTASGWKIGRNMILK